MTWIYGAGRRFSLWHNTGAYLQEKYENVIAGVDKLQEQVHSAIKEASKKQVV